MSNLLVWFQGLPAPLIVFLISMIPVVELRGAIVLAYFPLNLPWPEAFLLSVLGNMLPVPFLILLGRQILELLKKIKWLRNFVHRLEAKVELESEKIRKYSFWGLLLFVAIPLPGTGAWTGSLIACALRMRLRDAIPAILIGVMIAGLILSVLTYGLIDGIRI